MKVPPELVLAEGFLSASNIAALSGSSQFGKEEQEPLLICVCVTHTSVQLYYTHMERQEQNLAYCSPHCCLDLRSLTKPEVHCFLIGRPASQLLASTHLHRTPPSVLGLPAHTATPGFYVGAEDSNTGLQV